MAHNFVIPQLGIPKSFSSRAELACNTQLRNRNGEYSFAHYGWEICLWAIQYFIKFWAINKLLGKTTLLCISNKKQWFPNLAISHNQPGSLIHKHYQISKYLRLGPEQNKTKTEFLFVSLLFFFFNISQTVKGVATVKHAYISDIKEESHIKWYLISD